MSEQGNINNMEADKVKKKIGNPFCFPSQMFQSRFKSDEGGFYVLEKFTKRQSVALRGIENYRLAIFEAKPYNTFVLPDHCDADIVLNGRCSVGVTLLMQDRKESFNMEHGDLIRVLARATTYLINEEDVKSNAF